MVQVNLRNPIRAREQMENTNGRHEDIIWYIKPVSEVKYGRTQLN